MVPNGARVAATATALLLSACGGGSGDRSSTGMVDPPATTAAPPSVPGEVRPQVRPGLRAGQRVFFTQGCPACHRVGSAGSGDLGGELTTIGAQLSPAELKRAVRRGPDIMPSYDAMPPEMVDELVDYLSALR